MNESIQTRLEELYTALWCCSQYQEVGKGYIFTVFERMLINQERGALLSQLSDDPEAGIRYYEVPEGINERIIYINEHYERDSN